MTSVISSNVQISLLQCFSINQKAFLNFFSNIHVYVLHVLISLNCYHEHYIGYSSHRHRRTEQEEDEELLSECKKSNAAASFRFEESPSCKQSVTFINFW